MVPKCDMSGRFSSPSVYFFVGRSILGLLVNKSAYLFVRLVVRLCLSLFIYLLLCQDTLRVVVALQCFKQK